MNSVIISKQRQDYLGQILSQSQTCFGYLIGRRKNETFAEVLFFCQSEMPNFFSLSSPEEDESSKNYKYEKINLELKQLLVNFHSSSTLTVVGFYFGARQTKESFTQYLFQENNKKMKKLYESFLFIGEKSQNNACLAVFPEKTSKITFESLTLDSLSGKETQIQILESNYDNNDEKLMFFRTKVKFPIDLQLSLTYKSEKLEKTEKKSLLDIKIDKNSLFDLLFCENTDEIDENKLKKYISKNCVFWFDKNIELQKIPDQTIESSFKMQEKEKNIDIPEEKEVLKNFVMSSDKTNFIDRLSVNSNKPIQISSFFSQDKLKFSSISEQEEREEEILSDIPQISKIFNSENKGFLLNVSIFLDILLVLGARDTKIQNLMEQLTEKLTQQVIFAHQRLKVLFLDEKLQKSANFYTKILANNKKLSLFSFGFFHFRPKIEFQSFPFPLTMGYCFDSESNSIYEQEIDNSYYLVKERESLQSKFFLSSNNGVPLFLATKNALMFKAEEESVVSLVPYPYMCENSSKKMKLVPKNVHLCVEWSPMMKLIVNNPQITSIKEKRDTILSNINSGKFHIGLVTGNYLYFHYLQDGFGDDGWGCAYRSCQTLISWLKFNLEQTRSRISSFDKGFIVKKDKSSIEIPKHKEIQTILVEEFKDKPSSFIGSSQWIGAFEISLLLSSKKFDLFGIGDPRKVQGKILSVSNGTKEELLSTGTVRKLIHHFKTMGSPVMIGGGVLAFTLLGIVFDEKKGDIDWLILDPHYIGQDYSENEGNISQTQQFSEEIFEKKGSEKKAWCGWRKTEIVFRKTTFYNFCLPEI